MKLSTKSRYALEGLLYITAYAPKEAVRIKQIAEYTKISVAYLEQIFFLLKKSGLLTAIRGSKGGYTRALPPEEITVGMIIRSIEPHIVPVDCVTDLSACHSRVRANCVSRQIWIGLNQSINQVVDHLTLKDLSERYLAQKTSQKEA